MDTSKKDRDEESKRLVEKSADLRRRYAALKELARKSSEEFKSLPKRPKDKG